MSQVVPITATPNQSLSIQVDDVRYSIRLRDIGSMMALDLSIDDVVILQGLRVVANSPLIPYEYLEGDGGNFLFITELGDLPHWDQFESTQTLLYVTATEIESARVN